MANLWISEYASPSLNFAAPQAPALVEQQIAIGAGSVQSAALNAATTYIRVVGDASCALAFGTNPTAAATAHFLPANVVAYYGVTPGTKVAVITAT